MKIPRPVNLRSRLTLWYVGVLAVLLLIYATIVFAFQYAVLTRQLAHDEVQDAVTVEGLLYFDAAGTLQLRQDYFSRPQTHMLVDRLMEVRGPAGNVLYRSATLHGMPLGGPTLKGEGDAGFDERIVRLENGTHVFLISHVHTLQGQTLIIRLGYSLAPLRERMMQFLALLLISIPLALLLAGVAGQWIAKQALRPLDRMTTRAEGITASNLGQRLEIQNPQDELGQMARVFNHLLDRLQQSFVQLQRFTADAAHELRAPLSAVRTIGEVALERGHGEEQYREALEDILEESSRLNETIESLLLLARAEATQPGMLQTPFVISELLDEVLDLLQIVIEEKQVRVRQQGEPAGRTEIFADRSLFRIAILNVLHNALKFAPVGSVLQITYSQTAERPGRLQIAIEDEGPGIRSGEHEQVFERFFTSSASATASQSGAGLGLAITKLIVERMGGSIRFDPNAKNGARCLLEVPVR